MPERDSLARGDHYYLAATVIVLAIAATYAPAMSAGFVNWDDDRFIYENPLFAGPLSDYVAAALGRVQFEAYQPLHLLSYVPDRLLWADAPIGFHALNLALAALAALVALTMLRRHVGTWPAMAAILLFVLHPLRVESVTWVTARKDVLALGLVLLAWTAFDRAIDAPPRHARWLRMSSLLLFALALLAKSAAAVAPLLVLSWAVWVRGRPVRETVWRLLPQFVIAALAMLAVARLWSDNRLLLPTRPAAWPIDVAASAGFYIQRTLFPFALSPVYPPAPSGYRIGAAAFAFFALLVVLRWKAMPPWSRFLTVGFVGGLLPVLNLAPLYHRFADRYALFAALALLYPIAHLTRAAFTRHRRATVLALAAILLAEGIATHRLSRAWADSVSLWSRAATAQPEALFAHVKLGESLRKQLRFRDAALAYLEGARRVPGSALPLAGLFVTFAERAEASAAVPTGTARLWQSRAAQARSLSDLQALLSEVEGAACLPCAQSLLWLALRLHPQSDAALVALATRALDNGAPHVAWVYLMVVRDPTTPGYAPLAKERDDPARRLGL